MVAMTLFAKISSIFSVAAAMLLVYNTLCNAACFISKDLACIYLFIVYLFIYLFVSLLVYSANLIHSRSSWSSSFITWTTHVDQLLT